MAVYRWSGHNGGVPAQVAGEHLSRLASENGERLTPRVVVDDARPLDAPLHPCFEWDDLKAAELHRENQARALIRSVRVVTQERNEHQPEDAQRVFVNIVEQVGEDAQHAYMPVAVVRRNPDLRVQVLQAARRDFMTWRTRYMDVARAIGAEDIEQKLDALVESGETTDAQPIA